MCINFETSVVAFGLGEITGLYLTTENSFEKKVIGMFVMFYSMIQLFEVLLYSNCFTNDELYSRLILLNLGFQGLIFFLLVSNYQSVNIIFIAIMSIISLGVSFFSLSDNFIKAEKVNGCLSWNFLHNNKLLTSGLGIMYVLILYWLLIESNNKYYAKCGIVLILTLLFSNYVKQNKNVPSMWCLSSAIAGPIFILL